MAVFDNSNIINDSVGGGSITVDGNDLVLAQPSTSDGNHGITGVMHMVGSAEKGLYFSFSRQQNQTTFYDNDYTDTFTSIAIYPNSEPSDLSHDLGSWRYHSHLPHNNGGVRVDFNNVNTMANQPQFLARGNGTTTVDQLRRGDLPTIPYDGSRNMILALVPDPDSSAHSLLLLIDDTGMPQASCRTDINLSNISEVTVAIEARHYSRAIDERLLNFEFHYNEKPSFAKYIEHTGTYVTPKDSSYQGLMNDSIRVNTPYAGWENDNNKVLYRATLSQPTKINTIRIWYIAGTGSGGVGDLTNLSLNGQSIDLSGTIAYTYSVSWGTLTSLDIEFNQEVTQIELSAAGDNNWMMFQEMELYQNQVLFTVSGKVTERGKSPFVANIYTYAIENDGSYTLDATGVSDSNGEYTLNVNTDADHMVKAVDPAGIYKPVIMEPVSPTVTEL